MPISALVGGLHDGVTMPAQHHEAIASFCQRPDALPKGADSEQKIFRRDNTPDLYIVIMATPDSPIVEIINKALTTAGLNVISWNEAYSLLPVPTMVFHKFYHLKPFDNALGKSLRERAKWGWSTRDMLWPDLTTRLISRKECHQIGGPSSLIIKLGNEPPGDYTPDHVLEGSVYSVVWKLMDTDRHLSITMQPGPVSCAHFVMHTQMAKSVVGAKTGKDSCATD
ncbi:hypothetical protein FOC1_g10001928 [Fusarium oxysporum f. sp. cubense race 1]|uniref:Uncharacterized protein n=1 Tax=Fusarium oxysporum f. sp. cubense (strain race 1) TaxID=1229664 RepID=N4U4G2_FUSC1|nr:hypothetical protein FOC1_g10001928 [Fusarium oxysporum f. sp. cubense race 1]